jgi:putative peptidoglycan lipid II flippase
VSHKLRNIGVVAGLTVVSRVLGLVRDQLSAAVFGTSALASAFVTAFRLPNLFRRLLGEGSLTAALVPTLQESLQREGRLATFRLMGQVASWLLVVSTSIVAVAMLLASQSRRWGGWEERWYMSADLAVLLFPYLIFVSLAAVFSAMLNVLQRFTEPALSPIWLNLSMISALGLAGLQWAETPQGRMLWLCSGVLVGGFLQMAVPAVVLMRLGWRPRFDLARSPGVREIARLMAPGLWGTAIYQINLFVAQMLAMAINDSAAAALFYANRLMELPIGVFAIAVATVIYPLIAKHAAAGNPLAMRDDYRLGVRLILAINVPAAAGLALLSQPIIRVLFERGEFDASDTRMMAPLLAAFALGMPFFSVVSLMTRAFYAVKDTSTPVKVATVSFVVNVVASLVLMRVMGATGLALASTLAVIVQAFVLQRRLVARLPHLAFAPLARDLGKILLGTLVLVAVVLVGWHFLRTHGRAGDWLALLVLIPGAAALYGATIWLLRIEGREQLTRMLLRRLPASPRGTGGP